MDEISDFSLMKKKYTLDVLERNVGKLDKKILLATQTLNAEFCINYIWDPDTESGSEDSYIYDFDYILSFQKQLTSEQLADALIKIIDFKLWDDLLHYNIFKNIDHYSIMGIDIYTICWLIIIYKESKN